MNAVRKISIILFSLAIMFGLVAASFLPTSAATDTASTCKQWHTVKRGEYLSMIARMYDTDWRTLAEINDLDNPSRIYPGQKLCVSVSGSGSGSPVETPAPGTGVRVTALEVEEDQYVTLQGKKMVANSRYTIYLSKYGAYPTGAIFMGSVLTDKNGAFTKTYRIPSKLVDIAKIAIHLSNGRDATSNWFINATAEGNTGGEGAPEFSFSISSVEEGEWVRIRTSNLPANVTFDVRMGKAGSKGVNGIKVGTLRDEDGGSLRATFDIPSQWQGRSKIDIRIENKALGIYDYVTFEN
jgi:LysM repeat protein